MPNFPPSRSMQLEAVFSDPYFMEAPSYQRKFVWTDIQAGQLLEDVTSALEADAGDYFLGTLLFLEREPEHDPSLSTLRSWRIRRPPASLRQLEIVDGLQRLTTLTILFCVLRDLGGPHEPEHARLLAAIGSGPGTGSRFRLSLGDPAQESFLHQHVRAPGATKADREIEASSPTEECILAVRDHFIDELTGLDQGARQQLAEFLLDRCYVMHVPARGLDRAHHMFTVLNARGMSLARNAILKALLLGKVEKQSVAACTAIWNEAEQRLGEGFEQLFSHIRAMYRGPDEKVISDIEEIADEKGGAQAFIELVLRPSAIIHQDICAARHSGHPESAAIAQYLTYLGWHSFRDWIPPAMLWCLERAEDTKGFLRFLAKLDRLAFGMRILGIGGKKRTRRFSAVAEAVRGGRDLDDPSHPLIFSRQELRSIQRNLRDLHDRNPPAAKHLLLRLCDVVAGTPQSSLLGSDLTVEHVLPRTLSANSPWRGGFADPEEREACTESLGNLVLVTKAQNDKAANLEFPRKLEIYFRTAGVPVPAINEDLRNQTEWKAAQIKAREVRLLQLIRKLWDFDPTPPREPDEPAQERKTRRQRRRSPASSR